MKNPQRKELAAPLLWEQLKPLAVEMRKQPTPAENRLWQVLRGRQAAGLKFRRQHAIGPFIVDFYCVSARLVVEVDGTIHDLRQEADQERQAYLESLGLKVLRFSNEDVLSNTMQVVQLIEKAAAD